jgi:DNA invertase Pin-like site-specific DNA recombinase
MMTTASSLQPIIPESARCIAYLRVSTEDQAREDAVSLNDQRRACERFAKDLDMQVDAVIEDRASGRSVNRPGFQTVLQFCEIHPRSDAERGIVVCLDSSRWGRFVKRPSLASTFADRLYLAGWDLHFVREPTTGNVDADVFLGAARGVASATESKRISYRASTGMRAQAKMGHWQGRPPFGYDRTAANPATRRVRRLGPYEHAAKGERCKLAPNDDAAIVKRIFRWVARGDLYKDIADRLNTKKVQGPFDIYPNRGGIDCWTACTVRAIAENPVYVGVHRFNRRTPFDTHGKRQVRPETEHIVIEGAHPAVVDRGTWEAVQARFNTIGPRRRSSRYLLTGLMRCETCGGSLVGGGGSRPDAADPERTVHYKCGTCREPMLTVNKCWLEGRVTKIVADFVTHLVQSGEFDSLLREALGQRRSSTKGQQARLEKARMRLERQRSRLISAVANGTLTEPEARGALNEVRAELEEVTAASERVRFHDRANTLSQRDVEALRARAADFPARLSEASSPTARQLLSHWLDGIQVDGDRREVTVTLRRLPLSSHMIPADRS